MGAEWTTVALDEVLEPVKRPIAVEEDQAYHTLGVRWYGNGAFLKAPKSGAQIAAKTMNAVEPGDIVYSKLFAWKGSFAVVSDSCRGAIASSEFPTYIPDTDRLLADFFALWAGRQEIWDAANDVSTGTTAGSRNRLAPDDFLELELDLPPVDEQHAIVAAEHRIQESLAANETVSKNLRQSYFALLEELIDGDNTPLSDLIDRIDAGVSPRCLPRPPLDGEYGVLKTAAVRHGSFRPDKAKALPSSASPSARAEVRPGDLLTIRASGSRHLVGALCRVPDGTRRKLLMSDYHWRLRLHDGVDPGYLVHATAQRDVRTQIDEAIAGSTTAGKLSRGRFLAVEVPVPSPDTQLEVASKLSVVWSAVRAQTAEAEALDRFRVALVDELVTGVRPARRLATE